MTTYVPPKVSTQYIFYVSLVSQANTKVMQSNPTIAAGDFKVSIDGGALANLGTLPTVTPASGKMVKITLSTSEMAGANATVVCSDASGAEWCDLTINIQTSARQIDDLAYPATSGRSMVVDASGLVDANTVKLGPTGSGTAQTARDIGGSVLLSNGTGTGQIKLASGYVAMTWADVGSPTTTVVLSGTTVATATTLTGHTPQTGDAYAIVNSGVHGNAAIKGYVDDIGVAGAGLTALGDTRLANLDATVSSRGTSTLTQTQVTGGAYSIQSASAVLGDARIANLDATVSSRLASASYTSPPSAATISTQVASDLASAHGAGSWATATGFSTLVAADIRNSVGLASANLDTQITILRNIIIISP